MTALEYAKQIAEALNDKFPVVNPWDESYSVDTRGKKYIRVTKVLGNSTGKSVALFVDSEGNVYKAAGWTAPAKGVRFNVATDEGMAAMITKADRFGSYLYR